MQGAVPGGCEPGGGMCGSTPRCEKAPWRETPLRIPCTSTRASQLVGGEDGRDAGEGEPSLCRSKGIASPRHAEPLRCVGVNTVLSTPTLLLVVSICECQY